MLSVFPDCNFPGFHQLRARPAETHLHRIRKNPKLTVSDHQYLKKTMNICNRAIVDYCADEGQEYLLKHMNFLVNTSHTFARKQLAIKESLSNLPAPLANMIESYALDIMNDEVQQEINVRFSHFKLLIFFRFTHHVVKNDVDDGESYLRCLSSRIKRTFYTWRGGYSVERTDRFGELMKCFYYCEQTVDDCKKWWEIAYLEEQAERRREIYGRITGRVFDSRFIPIHRSVLSIRWSGITFNPKFPDRIDYFFNFRDRARLRRLRIAIS